MSNSKNLLQNRYRLRTVLGTGGFSTIYLAIDETTGKEVSVKEFTAEHMDGLATVLRNNAYDIASQSEPQPVPDLSSISGEVLCRSAGRPRCWTSSMMCTASPHT